MQRNACQRFIWLILLFLLILALTACKWEQKHELALNREKWQAQNITDYRYKVSIISHWGANEFMPLTMVYEDGQLVSVVDNEGNAQELYWDAIGGLEAIFHEVEDALANKRRNITDIQYDLTYGFPAYVDIYYHESGVGGETSRRYTISDFEVLTNP